jgi:hypothetical protein
LRLEAIRREEGKGKLGFKKEGVYDYIESSFRIKNGAGDGRAQDEKKRRKEAGEISRMPRPGSESPTVQPRCI